MRRDGVESALVQLAASMENYGGERGEEAQAIGRQISDNPAVTSAVAGGALLLCLHPYGRWALQAAGIVFAGLGTAGVAKDIPHAISDPHGLVDGRWQMGEHHLTDMLGMLGGTAPLKGMTVGNFAGDTLRGLAWVRSALFSMGDTPGGFGGMFFALADGGTTSGAASAKLVLANPTAQAMPGIGAIAGMGIYTSQMSGSGDGGAPSVPRRSAKGKPPDRRHEPELGREPGEYGFRGLFPASKATTPTAVNYARALQRLDSSERLTSPNQLRMALVDLDAMMDEVIQAAKSDKRLARSLTALRDRLAARSGRWGRIISEEDKAHVASIYGKIDDFVEETLAALDREAGAEMAVLGEVPSSALSTPPDMAAVSMNLAKQTREVLATMTPREQAVLRIRFGVGGPADKAVVAEEVAAGFETTPKRIRQIEAEALRKLKHPSRSERLKSFVEE